MSHMQMDPLRPGHCLINGEPVSAVEAVVPIPAGFHRITVTGGEDGEIITITEMNPSAGGVS